MEFKGFKIDFVGLSQLIGQLGMAIAAVLAAWKGVNHAQKKKGGKNDGRGTEIIPRNS